MKILLPIDDSDFSKAALTFVRSHFNPQETRVHVFHVIEPLRLAPRSVGTGVGPSVPGDYIGQVENWVDRAEDLVARTTRILESAGFTVAKSVGEGDAKSEILDFAAQWQPDLIILGSHGRTGIKRFLLGSVSDGVSRHAGCSVLIVRLPTAPSTSKDVSPVGE
jgi:nucleotide-binding universal stress UspA family protein